MITPTQVAVLYPAVFAVIIGIAYIKFPQEMFHIRNWPFGSEGDGLTDAGEKTYRRLGIFLLLISVGLSTLIFFL